MLIEEYMDTQNNYSIIYNNRKRIQEPNMKQKSTKLQRFEFLGFVFINRYEPVITQVNTVPMQSFTHSIRQNLQNFNFLVA